MYQRYIYIHSESIHIPIYIPLFMIQFIVVVLVVVVPKKKLI
jgi:hypothetical protein